MGPNEIQAIQKAFRNGQLVFFLDIDGTLSEFKDDKMQAFIDKDIADWIYAVEECFPGTVVFVTGRPLEEAQKLLKLTDETLLFERLGYFNGIFNHGMSLYVNQSVKEIKATAEFQLSKEQLDHLRKAIGYGQNITRKFARENNLSILEDNNDGIKVKNGESEGSLLEIKRDEHDLSSMAFHWRVINGLPCCKDWNALVDDFAANYAGQHNFQMPANSDMVRELALPFDKGTMVKKSLEEVQEFANKKYVIAAGDAAENSQGTDWPMLEYVLDLNKGNEKTGMAFHVLHGTKTASSLPGIQIVNGVAEMIKLLLGLNLVEKLEMLSPEEPLAPTLG